MVEIDLYVWPLLGPDAALRQHLSPDEAQRAARFLRPAQGAAFAVGRGHLREILGGYTGQDPGALRFSYNEQGKPALPGGPLFNLSHAGGWAALAVCADAPPGLLLGLDIEAHRPVEVGVADRFFSPAEVAAMPAPEDPGWAAAFFRIWTRKEAVVKALGPGLTMPLADFDVTQTEGRAAITRIEGVHARGGQASRPGDWQLCDLAPGPGMAGALALCHAGAPPRLTLREGCLPLPPGPAAAH